MMKKEIDLEKLKKHITKKTKGTSLNAYFERLVLAQELQQITSSKLKNRPKLSIKTKQNLIINTVTALVVFFKDLIIEFKGKWNDQGLDKLLTGNSIPLNVAFTLFRGKTVKKEHLICHYFSFQSLHTFDNVFSNLLDTTKFLEDLGKFE